MIDEHTAAERALHQAQRQIVAESQEVLHREIDEAQAAHQLVVDGWHAMLAEAMAELSTAEQPHPDPQIAALLAQGNQRLAAEILAGRRQAEAGIARDRAIAAAERRHQQRINDA